MGGADPHRDTRALLKPLYEVARAHGRDRYLAALLSPAAARDDLVVLAAYLGEIDRVPLLARDPTIGEIRLQWWRDALAERAPASGNPVADAILDVAHRRSLDRNSMLVPIEGRSRELYEDGIRDAADFEQYADETEGAGIRLALAISGAALGPEGEAAARNAARALTFTRLALTLPQHLAHGRLPLPAETVARAGDPRGLDEADARAAAGRLAVSLAEDAGAALAAFRQEQVHLGAEVRTAFLRVGLVAPYLRAVLKPGRDPLLEIADISPLSRVVRLWFAQWRGRI